MILCSLEETHVSDSAFVSETFVGTWCVGALQYFWAS